MDKISLIDDKRSLLTQNDKFNEEEQTGDFSSDDDDEDYIETENDVHAEAKCLFCALMCKNVDTAISHLHEAHNVDLAALKARFNMDCYSFIKLINCISTDHISAEQLKRADIAFWDDDKYLAPSAEESWLTYDFDELTCADLRSEEEAIDKDEIIRQQKAKLEEANEHLIRLRESLQRLIGNDDNGAVNANYKDIQCVANMPLESDRDYFATYSHFGIHKEMLSDVVRTTSYRDAILKNKDFICGKTVLDVGCGTSVLSYFAAQAQAKEVIGIDNSDIIYNAIEIIKENNVENVRLVKGRLEDTELPIQKFDIIISEWMGYFLIFEGMLDSIIYARKTHLKENGLILPNRCTLSIVGYGNDELHKAHIGFWDNVYGLNMDKMGKEAQHEPLIQTVDEQHILTNAEVIADLHMSTVELDYANFAHKFNFVCEKSGNFSSIVGYFDTFFDLPNSIMFSTSPKAPPTHWKQVVFFIDQQQAVKAGDIITGKFVCQRISHSARSLKIAIEVFGKRYTYHLD